MTESLMTYHACSCRDMTQDKKYKIKGMSVRKTRGGSRHLNWLVGFFLILILGTGFAAADEPKKFTLINVLLDGTKIWLPSSIIVQEGDAVELTLVNKLDDPHGFEIKAFGIEQVVQPKSEMTVKFTAS
jgi:heme/copper-type cytochrome/quinol oxidase subunit 2